MSNHPRHAFANGRRTILGDVGVNRVCPEGLKPIQNQNPPCTVTAAAVAEDASYAVAEPPLYVRRHDPYLWHVVEFGYLCSMPLPGTQFPQVSIEDACDQLPPPYADLHDQSLNYTANVDWCNVSACTDSPAADATADLQHNASFDMPSWNDTSSASPVKRLAEVEPSRRPSPDGRRIVAPEEPAKVAITKVADANVALVAFGVRATWYAIYGGSLQSAPAPGTYVVVPGDRGIDVGIVIEIARARGQLCSREWRQYLPAWRVPLAAPIAPAGLPRLHIMRRANNSEVSLCRTRRSDHTAAILRTQNAVNEFARRERIDSLLTMKVVAVEYQHDCGKVTIYFESPIASLRIADLAVNLFKSTFRCRVWLHQLESAPMLP